MKIPAAPGELGLANPYPELEVSWGEAERDWGWTVPSIEQIPDVSVAIDLVRRFHPENGPLVGPVSAAEPAAGVTGGKGPSVRVIPQLVPFP